MKDLDNARFKYLRATSLDPNFLYPYIELARIHAEDGKFLEAKMYSDEAVEIIREKLFIKDSALDYRIKGNDIDVEFEVYTQRRDLAIALENFNEAKALIKKALETKEKKSLPITDAKLQLASILIIENKIEDALDILTEISPKNFHAARMKEYIKAIMNKNLDPLAFKYFYLSSWQNNKDKELALLEKSHEISPFFTYTSLRLVREYFERNMIDKAIAICLATIEHNPRDHDLRYSLADIFEIQLRLDDTYKVIKDLERLMVHNKKITQSLQDRKQRIIDKKTIIAQIDNYITFIQKHDMTGLYNLQSDFSKAQINEYTFSEHVKEHWPHPIILHTIDSIDSLDRNHMLAKIIVHEDERKKINLVNMYFILAREQNSWTFLSPEDETIQEIYLDQRKDLKNLIHHYTSPDVRDDHAHQR